MFVVGLLLALEPLGDRSALLSNATETLTRIHEIIIIIIIIIMLTTINTKFTMRIMMLTMTEVDDNSNEK